MRDQNSTQSASRILGHSKWCDRRGEGPNVPGDYCSTCGKRLRAAKPKGRDWTVHPGATLKDWRDEKGISAKVMAKLCHLERAEYDGIESGEDEITDGTAAKLAYATGVPVRFWLRYEAMYREDLAAGRSRFDA